MDDGKERHALEVIDVAHLLALLSAIVVVVVTVAVAATMRTVAVMKLFVVACPVAASLLVPWCPRLTVSWRAGEPQQPRAACRGKCDFRDAPMELNGASAGHNAAGVRHVGSVVAVSCAGGARGVSDAGSNGGMCGASDNGDVSGVCNTCGVNSVCNNGGV